MAGLWCASLGFSERRLADAAHRQMLTLPYCHTFFAKGHEPAVELAERLLAIAPPSMARVLFQCSGSEANDAAIKLAWNYWGVQGQPQRRKFIGRVRGYHGNTVATASLFPAHRFVAIRLQSSRWRSHRRAMPAVRCNQRGHTPMIAISRADVCGPPQRPTAIRVYML